jgi:endothelin-converting enzyme/putative endopeptidase
LGVVSAFSQTSAVRGPDRDGTAKTYSVPRFDVATIDKSVDPCVDFYNYACGNWIRNNPIPADHSVWMSFLEVQDHNYAVMRQILEKASVSDPKRSSEEQKIGDFYSACTDEQVANRKGYDPLKPELDRIAAVKDKSEMAAVMAHEYLIGPNPLFNFSSQPDVHNAQITMAVIDQGGITLPDRDYYLKDDPDMVTIRKAYSDHMTKMFTMIGQSPAQAAESAATVMKIETELAKAAMDRTLRRDPKVTDHTMAVKQIEEQAPNLHLDRYFLATGAPSFTRLNVANPDYFKTINSLIQEIPLEQWKTYMTWQVLHNAAPWLSNDFVQENFKFSRTLSGQKELRPRWKRCIDATDNTMGEALGHRYVEETFGTEGKERMLKMVDALERALRQDITALPWMTEATKKQALIKLQAIRNKIGYPEKWRDYSRLTIERSDLIGNLERASEFEAHRQLTKIDKPTDKLEWEFSPPTVNAYYNGERNEIVFPAGILQPPFFDRSMDDAVNFGGIGYVIGHELTHGFDDEGRQFDPQGNLRDWWTAEDAKRFEERASCIADEYSGFTAVDDLKLNGKLTLGENTADNGGARIALMALHEMLKQSPDADKKIDGYSPDQRYFLGIGRVWCQNITPENLRLGVRTDEHSPGRWRVNGVLQNMPEFQQAFGCKAGQPMVRANACRVW